MAKLQGFDAAAQRPMKDFDPLPTGTYEMAVTTSEWRKPKNQAEKRYLYLEITVLSGESKGRKHFRRLNVRHSNEIAAEISRAELGAICNAVGVVKPMLSEELHNKPMFVAVRRRKDSDGVLENSVSGYFATEPGEIQTDEPAPEKPVVVNGSTAEDEDESPFMETKAAPAAGGSMKGSDDCRSVFDQPEDPAVHL